MTKWNLEYSNAGHRHRGLRSRSSAARLLRFWVRIPQETWMSVCCECCVLSGRGVCFGLITRPEKSYRLRCVVVCGLETSLMRRPCHTGGFRALHPLKQLINEAATHVTCNSTTSAFSVAQFSGLQTDWSVEWLIDAFLLLSSILNTSRNIIFQ